MLDCPPSAMLTASSQLWLAEMSDRGYSRFETTEGETDVDHSLSTTPNGASPWRSSGRMGSLGGIRVPVVEMEVGGEEAIGPEVEEDTDAEAEIGRG